MRRRHGIPDNDHRPFNVAYAAAQRAQKEKEGVLKTPNPAAVQGADQELRQRGASESWLCLDRRPPVVCS